MQSSARSLLGHPFPTPAIFIKQLFYHWFVRRNTTDCLNTIRLAVQVQYYGNTRLTRNVILSGI